MSAFGPAPPTGPERSKCPISLTKATEKSAARDQQLWDRYSVLIIGVALVIILGVAGWRGYDWWETRQATEWGASFEAAAALAEAGKHAEAAAAFQKIAAEGTSGYRMLARFRAAAELAPSDPAAAVKAYDAIAADARWGAMQDLARFARSCLSTRAARRDDIAARGDHHGRPRIQP